MDQLEFEGNRIFNYYQIIFMDKVNKLIVLIVIFITSYSLINIRKGLKFKKINMYCITQNSMNLMEMYILAFNLVQLSQ